MPSNQPILFFLFLSAVPRNTPVDTSILQIVATDPDEGGANIAYAITLADFIKNGKSQAATEVFSIDEDTGRITTNQLLTNYVKGYFDLTITATDTDTGLFATALARVKSSLFFNLLNYACRTFCLPNRQHNCYVIIFHYHVYRITLGLS